MRKRRKRRISAGFGALARLSLKLERLKPSPLRTRAMFKIRLSFAVAATVCAALTTFVTVAPQAAKAGTFACLDVAHEPVRA